ncbi:MAG TPA: dihydrolipoamide acetyltransferase family protein [Candidatus Cloacimonadota bacterium]|nr:dihydrolipoamide acetyltransferase family protein [Candidatus Cloacimonadota bacterium]HPT72742.1 dihydrolipoamide acetyltransferase family protein [Candidatus Cloacimonadota bacterium]
MRYAFKFPDIGEGITEGKIVEWYVEKGQSVKSGEALVKMETDKVVTDIPSPKSGVLTERYGNVGDIVNVGHVLVEIEIEGVAPEEAKQIAREIPQAKTEVPIEEKSFGVVGTLEVAGEGAYLPASGEGFIQKSTDLQEKVPVKAVGTILATPVARAMAKDLGIDIREVTGTGPAGRIMKEDIRKYFEGKSKPAQPLQKEPEIHTNIEIQPLSMIRKTIAKNMARSKQNAVHMTVIDEIEVEELYRERLNHKEEFIRRGSKLTYLPFIMKAVVDALKEHPVINAELDLEHDRMLLKHYYNIGIAMDTPEGLVVPVVRDVDKKSIYEIANELLMLEKKASERALTLDDLKDGTFTITNYGTIGGMYGVPVINYPQVGILGVGRIQEKPVVKDHQIVIANVMALSLVCDHRIVDGAEAGRFLKQIMDYLHDPGSLLLY